MPTSVVPVTLPQLTTATLEGGGVLDVLMRTMKAHLEDQFTKGRIKGPEYATVYLGSLEPVLRAALEFLLQKDKTALEAQLLEVQLQVAQVQLLTAQVEKQKAEAELLVIEQQLPKILAEIAVLNATKCKLDAEFDVLGETKLKTAQETQLLIWKVNSEKAQTQAVGVEADSVIGKQKLLYAAQTDGFKRDAEQKATKIMVDSWNVRRTTDEGTVADATNMLNDAAVGRAVNALLAGIGA
jgi:hypothetical protein